MADEVSGNIVVELSKRENFGSFSEYRIKLLLYVMWNKVEYDLNDSRRVAGQLEYCSDSKGMESVLNGRTFRYNFWGSRFNMLHHSYKLSPSLV